MKYVDPDPDFQKKLEDFEQRKPEWQQLQALKDIADISQEMLGVLDDSKDGSNKQLQQLGVALLANRDELVKLNARKDPDTPDYSTPIVKALSDLATKLDSKNFNPTIKVDAPKVDVPTPIANVTVAAPKVDTKGIEKAVSALQQTIIDSIASIPQVEIPEAIDRWDEVIEWLKSIDTASRLKPQPGVMKVTNPDGSSIGSLSGSTEYESANDTTTDTNLVYLGKATPGSAYSAASWQIKRYDKAAGTMTFADDATTYTNIWDNRTTYTY